MRKIKTDEEAIQCLNLIVEDFKDAMIGEWIPDDDSCEASITVLRAVIKYIRDMSPQG